MRSGRVARRAAAVREQATRAAPTAGEPLIGAQEKRLAAVLIGSVALALLLPFPPVKYGLAAVLGLVYFHQLAARPDLALAIFVIALPLIDLLPPQIVPVPGLNPQTILVVSLLARMFGERPGPQKVSNPFTFGLVLFSLALLVGTVISVLSHGYPVSTLVQTAKNHIIVIPVLYFVARVIKTDKQRKIVLLSMALLLFLMSAHTIWDTRDQIARGLLLERHRAVGLLAGQANLYGGWLAMMVLAAICFCFSPVLRGRARLFLAGTTFMSVVALVYTLSRGAWVALVVSLAVVAILRNRRILLLGTLVVFLLPALVSPAVRERAASITEIFDSMEDEPETMDAEADDSAMVRIVQWQAVPGILADAPLLGHGYGYFPELWWKMGHAMKAAHSSFIEIAAELGLLGLLGYAALVLPMIVLGWKHSRRELPPLQRTVGTAAFGIGVCLLLLDTSGTRFRNSEVMANFWILAGMLVGTWETHLADPTATNAAILSRGTPKPPPDRPRPGLTSSVFLR